MGYEKPDFKKKKTPKGTIRIGTYVTLFDGSRGIVIDSDRSHTTIKEIKYRDFESTVSMTTSQAKQLVDKE